MRKNGTLGLCTISHFSHVQLCVMLWTVAHQDPLSMGFSRQEYWGGSPCPPPRDLSDPRIESMSFMFDALAGRFFTTWEAQLGLFPGWGKMQKKTSPSLNYAQKNKQKRWQGHDRSNDRALRWSQVSVTFLPPHLGPTIQHMASTNHTPCPGKTAENQEVTALPTGDLEDMITRAWHCSPCFPYSHPFNPQKNTV